MVFHLVYNLCLFAPLVLAPAFGDASASALALGDSPVLRMSLAAACGALAVALLTAMMWFGKWPPYVGLHAPVMEKIAPEAAAPPGGADGVKKAHEAAGVSGPPPMA
jgi:hypothetical protein